MVERDINVSAFVVDSLSGNFDGLVTARGSTARLFTVITENAISAVRKSYKTGLTKILGNIR
jgi:hypothetical protein